MKPIRPTTLLLALLPVAAARITVPEVDPTAGTLVADIERIKSDLVQSLPRPQPVMPVDYSN